MIADWITRAIEAHGWTFDEVAAGIEAGDFYLFHNDTAAIVCEVIQSPRHSVFHCWAAGGDMDGVLSLVEEAEAFGRSLGCGHAGATGRVGWVRTLAKLGYSPATAAVEKEL